MYGLNESRKVPSQDLQLIYDECLRPLALRQLSNMATHWPASYASALTLYRDNGGRIHPGSLDIPAHILPVFGQHYLDRLTELRPYFRDAYFVHELRGWKGATIHDPSNEPDKVSALEDLLRNLNMDAIVQDDWQIDVAMELGIPGHIVAWRTSNHQQLLQHCLPSLNNAEISNLMDRQAFVLDRSMHLKDISGFRCSPGVKGRQDNVTYIQAYMTEKTMAYQQHQGLFTDIEPKALLSMGSLDKLVKNIERMSDVLFDCTGEENNTATQDGCARIEVRVRLSDALDALEGFPMQRLRRCLVAIPSKHWWYKDFLLSSAIIYSVFSRYFKWYRLAAMYAVMKNLLQSSLRDRKTECSIALGAITIWLINGLYHRPDVRFNELAKEACQLVPLDYDNYDEDINEEEDCAPLMYDAGLYFVCDIATDQKGTYRIPYHKTFSEEALVAAFRLSLREIREAMGITEITHIRIKANVERSNNRTRKRTIRVDEARDEDRLLPQIQNANLQNLRVRPAQRMRGDDVDHYALHGGGNRIPGLNDANPAHQEVNMVVRVQKLLEQFFYDLIQQAPNHKAAKDGSWTNIPVSMRLEEGTEELYKSLALPFFAAQYTFCDSETWKKHFDRFFPLKMPTRIGQNFGQASYYIQWLELVNTLSIQSVARVRQTIKVKYDTLLWVPATQYDRIWGTSANYTRGWHMLPRDQRPCGPQIALNPKARNPRYGQPFLRPPPVPQAEGNGQPGNEQDAEEQAPEDQDQNVGTCFF